MSDHPHAGMHQPRPRRQSPHGHSIRHTSTPPIPARGYSMISRGLSAAIPPGRARFIDVSRQGIIYCGMGCYATHFGVAILLGWAGTTGAPPVLPAANDILPLPGQWLCPGLGILLGWVGTTGAPPALPAANDILPLSGQWPCPGLRASRFFPVRGNRALAAGNAVGIPVVKVSPSIYYYPVRVACRHVAVMQPTSGLLICGGMGRNHGCASGATRG